ncbi:MAG: ParB/RepB/Spo0J family partition protein [Thermaerobacter sp.]|nr:ParB/RepB/Spo0J family partition protein [Thermaerobacter sp.]
MEVTDLPLAQLLPAPWNPNEMDAAALGRLAASIGRFGMVLPLVVRPVSDQRFEVLGGNQRLRLYREQKLASAPCVVVHLDDMGARLLAQALNAVHGQDDLNKKAALIRDLLAAMPEEDVLAILPDTAEALRGLASIGQQSAASLAEALNIWEQARAVRLERVSFPFTAEQREVVEKAISKALPRVAAAEEPNRRALALVEICREWLRGSGVDGATQSGGDER